MPVDAIRRWSLDRRNYFLFAGRLSPEKGLEGLIEAHRALESDCRLVIAGGSSYSDKYIQRLRSLAGPKVVFTGLQCGTVLQELYSNALAFVLPSEIEGLSVALLEAMAHGLPVIVSDIPENRELVDECGGYLFPTGNVARLAHVMQTLLANRDGAERMGERARASVRKNFDWERVARDTERFYLELMGESNSREEQDVAVAGSR
jgi:glycosyltransferase involved in cell wall biosynthesis